MKTFKFEREEDNKWYIVLPEWKGAKEELEMVLGADTMLDIISQGENSCYLTISKKSFEDHQYLLTFVREEAGGGWYNLTGAFFNFEVWLCHVTKFVFGYLPEKIYLK